jgi:hypothetical protein
MAGLVPAIYVFASPEKKKTWMPGTSSTRPGMTGVGKRPRMAANPKFTLAEVNEPR